MASGVALLLAVLLSHLACMQIIPRAFQPKPEQILGLGLWGPVALGGLFYMVRTLACLCEAPQSCSLRFLRVSSAMAATAG
jgi:hypothetical protein